MLPNVFTQSVNIECHKVIYCNLICFFSDGYFFLRRFNSCSTFIRWYLTKVESGAVALEHCAVCEIPFDALCRLSEYISPLQRNFLRILSQTIVAEQKLAAVLSTGDAAQRLAAFLLHMAAQNQRRGLSTHQVMLPMSRHDIGNFLGMTLETVSRLFSRLARRGWIRVRRREITLLDRDALDAAANHLRL